MDCSGDGLGSAQGQGLGQLMVEGKGDFHH